MADAQRCSARPRAARGRFMRNAFVMHPPHVRFYAGCPLLSSTGHRLGSLCIVDTAPRRLGADKLRMLSGFADLAVRQLEKRVALRRQLTSNRKRAPCLLGLGLGLALCLHSADACG